MARASLRLQPPGVASPMMRRWSRADRFFLICGFHGRDGEIGYVDRHIIVGAFGYLKLPVVVGGVGGHDVRYILGVGRSVAKLKLRTVIARVAREFEVAVGLEPARVVIHVVVGGVLNHQQAVVDAPAAGGGVADDEKVVEGGSAGSGKREEGAGEGDAGRNFFHFQVSFG